MKQRVGLLLMILGLLGGCRDLMQEKPPETDLVGVWIATKIDDSVKSFLRTSGVALRSGIVPSFELKRDGAVVVVNLPSATGMNEAVVFDAVGSWRVSPFSQADETLWHLHLFLPKRGLTYTFHRDRRGVYLKEVFDLDGGTGIEFRRRE